MFGAAISRRKAVISSRQKIIALLALARARGVTIGMAAEESNFIADARPRRLTPMWRKTA
jgi:hypothetical protein